VERGPGVARIDLERLAQVALGLGAIRGEPPVRLGRRDVEAGREGAIGGGLGLAQVLLGELVPVRGGDLEILERLLDHHVPGPDRVRLLERGLRRGHVEQIAVEQHALLEQEADLEIGLRRRRELGLEQPQGRVRAAALLERLARGGEPRDAHVGRGLADRAGQRLDCLEIIRITLEYSEDRSQVSHREGAMVSTNGPT
jgi:hypothetical protein